MAWVAMGVMAVAGAYSASEGAKATNAAGKRAEKNAKRRYDIESGIAEDQMDEQNQLAMGKMTEISRAFMVAKGRATAVQAETQTTGVSSERVNAVERGKYSEAKGKVAQEINTNVINIAQGMIANQIDTEALINEARASKKNVFTETLMGGIQGAAQGASVGSAMKGSGIGAKTDATKTTNTNWFKPTNTDVGF